MDLTEKVLVMIDRSELPPMLADQFADLDALLADHPVVPIEPVDGRVTAGGMALSAAGMQEVAAYCRDLGEGAE